MGDAVYEFFNGATCGDIVFSGTNLSNTITVTNNDYDEVMCFLVNGGYSFQSNQYGGNSGDATLCKLPISTRGIPSFSADITVGVGAINSSVTLRIGSNVLVFQTTNNHFSTNCGGELPNSAEDNNYYSTVLSNVGLTGGDLRFLNTQSSVVPAMSTMPGRGYGAGYSDSEHGGGGNGYIPMDLQFVTRCTHPTAFSNLAANTQLVQSVVGTGYPYIPGYILLRFYVNIAKRIKKETAIHRNKMARLAARKEAIRLENIARRRMELKKANIEARRQAMRLETIQKRRRGGA